MEKRSYSFFSREKKKGLVAQRRAEARWNAACERKPDAAEWSIWCKWRGET